MSAGLQADLDAERAARRAQDEFEAQQYEQIVQLRADLKALEQAYEIMRGLFLDTEATLKACAAALRPLRTTVMAMAQGLSIRNFDEIISVVDAALARPGVKEELR